MVKMICQGLSTLIKEIHIQIDQHLIDSVRKVLGENC